jgi:GH35 family endo-1,4-beta-xylanase
MARIGAGGEEWRQMDEDMGRLDSPESRQALADAKANIPRIRQRDVELRIVDTRGRPVPRARVEVELTRHDFPFGDNLWRLDRMHDRGQADADRGRYYKRRFTEVLNAANALCYWTERPRNDGPKTEDLQGQPRLEGFRYCVDWAASQELTVKGHPLFWTVPKAIPDWLLDYDIETQWRFVEIRIRQLIAAGGGRVRIWDLVNEPMWEPLLANVPRRSWPHLEPVEAIAAEIARVLGWARDEDPDAAYLVNDYGMEGGRDVTGENGTRVTSASQRGRYMDMLRCMCQMGAAPDGVGLQAHTGGWQDHAAQSAVYDEFATLQLPLHITEFWVRVNRLLEAGVDPDEAAQRQAQYAGDYLTVAFGHPAIEAFFFWGLMGWGIDWKDTSGHQVRPVFQRIGQLIHQEWHTRETLTTDADGQTRFRGFLGRYSLRFRLDSGMTTGRSFHVEKGQQGLLTIQLPTPFTPSAAGTNTQ